jgi:aminopeptidase N
MFLRFLSIFFFFLLAIQPDSLSAEEGGFDYDLKVSFDIGKSKIIGEARIRLGDDRTYQLHSGNLKIIEANLGGRPIELTRFKNPLTLRTARAETLEIKYEGVFMDSGPFPGWDNPGLPSVIGDRGIWMTGIWYPKPDGLGNYKLTAILPSRFEAISEGVKIEKENRNGQTVFSFHFPHPVEGLHLIASDHFEVRQDRLNDIGVFTYFSPENAGLSATYLAKAKEYLSRYEKVLGPYPYPRFAIVENFLPTGYSLPTFTLLGSGVIKLPFIVDTSLGHEILHQWFGNLVYVDYARGNWAEGLTTYLADHWFEAEKGRGWEYRKNALIEYQSYVNEENEYPLGAFRSRNDKASEAIGYGKGLMVFHMLAKMVGEEAFHRSLRDFVAGKKFQKAGWKDILEALGKNISPDAATFFTEWIEGKGLLEIGLGGEVTVNPVGHQFEVTLPVLQKQKAYFFDLPISVYSTAGKTRRIVPIRQEKTQVRILVDDFPQKIILDEDYDLARRLSGKEIPPVIARLLGERRPIVVLPSEGPERYAQVVEFFKRRGLRTEDEKRLSQSEMKESSLIVFGSEGPPVEKWFGAVPLEGGFSLTIRENPWNDARVVGVIQARSKEEADAGFPKIRHYGKFSRVAFEKGLNVSKKVDSSDRGIVREIAREPVAVEIPALKSLAEVLEKVADKKIIYVGESHDRFAHHLVQLEVIKGLYRRGKKIAIGMEMFQRPFQKGIDDYLSGRIDEREFLKNTEYFRRWRFDYNYYRPILEFAREAKIPVIALNAPREITDKISQGGLEALSADEKKGISAELDFSDQDYREKLKKVFDEHREFGAKIFDHFYQVQIAWDETMAESVDFFLRENPEAQMVVLAGSGHLAEGSGIPQRARRRNGQEYAILLNDGPIEKGAATYIVFSGPAPFEGAPKLMVFLREEKGKAVIEDFSEGSVAEKAGLRKGDLVLSIDETPVQSYEDIRLEMFFKRRGEPVQVKIRRRGASGEDEEIRFHVIPR